MARSLAEWEVPTIYEAGDIAVANLSYSYGFNGFLVPDDKPWLANEIDLDSIAAEATAARAAGAEYVIVSLHWGTEYRHAPNQFQLDVADALLEVDEIDLIIGHHAHVVQPIDNENNTFVVYGLGNFLSNQSANCCAVGSQDGVIVEVHLTEIGSVGGDAVFRTELRYIPTWVDRDDFTIVPVLDALTSGSIDAATERMLLQSRERTTGVINDLGASGFGVSEALPIATWEPRSTGRGDVAEP